MDKRGEGVPIILEESLKLSGKLPLYRLIVKGEPAVYHVMSRRALHGFVLEEVEKVSSSSDALAILFPIRLTESVRI